ncbi:MAG TPA: hypothetical protein VEK84_00510 [Terriglobales bacterium]|nr:hypothetical protein [Terriglobales bacterium]
MHQIEKELMFSDGRKEFNVQLRELPPDIRYFGRYVLLQVITGRHEQRQYPEVPSPAIRELLRNLAQRRRSVLHKTQEHFVFADVLF